MPALMPARRLRGVGLYVGYVADNDFIIRLVSTPSKSATGSIDWSIILVLNGITG